MAASVKDYYQVLGVTKETSQDEIKKAYRKLARKHHPDLNPGDKAAEERFKEINEAYAVLGDPQRKAEYDRAGTTFEQFGGFEGGKGFDFTESFDMGDILGSIFGGRGRAEHYARGEDIVMAMELSLEDAFSGLTRPVNASRTVTCDACGGSGAETFQTCPNCKGTGSIQTAKGFFKVAQTCHDCGGTGKKVTSVCKKCKGRGRESSTATVKVKIPAGVDSGSVLRFRGMGNAGVGGGPPGDLIIEISLRPHPLFRRKGDDIYVQLPVTFGEAALGAKVEVPTIDSAAIMNIPAGTQGGQRFKLSGKGFVAPRTKGRGDEYVDIKIVVPKDIPERVKDAIGEIEALYREDPRKGMKKQ
ncbi:MAG: molecular chaperone DnaJ [Thermodesulfovibrionales bacterium]|jgi:molecular chaperone DnaJ